MCGQMRYAKPYHTALPKAGINWALISSGKVKALLDGSRRLAEHALSSADFSNSN